jgi:hypothetical protein
MVRTNMRITRQRFWVFFLLIASAAAQTAVSSPAAPPQDDNSRKARELLDQSIAALGGQAFLTYQSKSVEGRYYTFFHGQSKSVGTAFGAHSKYPDKDRHEVLHLRNYHILLWTVGNVPTKDKSDIVIIHNGTKGYEITFKGTAAESKKDTANFLRRREHSLDWVYRKWLNDPGVALFYEGTVVTSGKPADKVTVSNAQNDSVTLFLDQSTHLPVKKSYAWRDPVDKFRNVEEEIYDAYKEVQGINTPHSITRYYNDEMSYQSFLTLVAYNQNVPDALFDATITYTPKVSRE